MGPCLVLNPSLILAHFRGPETRSLCIPHPRESLNSRTLCVHPQSHGSFSEDSQCKPQP